MRYNKITAVFEHHIKSTSRATRDSQLQYISGVRRFGKWLDQRYGTQRVNPENTHELIQTYINERHDTGLSAQTVNSDLASLCAGSGESKSDYNHPKRNQAPTRGRTGPGMRTPSGARIYDIAPAIGIRQAEYRQLRGRDIKEEDGYVYIHVSKGKGGKEQWQLTDPLRTDEIRSLFSCKKPDEFIFTKKEIDSIKHANLHYFRREHARDMYEWYLERSSEERIYWREKLKERYDANPYKSWAKVEKRIREVPTIICRGQNRERLKSQGREITFDREAVIFVSVMCLAHYREDVTVTNYLI